MALSRCPRESCKGAFFEIKQLTVQGASAGAAYNAIQCSTCGAVVAVTEHLYLSDLLQRIAKALKL